MATSTQTTNAPTISLEAAQAIVSAALDGSKDAGFGLAIAVVDAGGALRAFGRSDTAPFLTVDVSINKAWTAASYGYSTDLWNDYIANPKIAPLAQTPRMLAVGGGYPLMVDGQIVGGVGVSGGDYDQDREMASAALRATGFDPEAKRG